MVCFQPHVQTKETNVLVLLCNEENKQVETNKHQPSKAHLELERQQKVQKLI